MKLIFVFLIIFLGLLAEEPKPEPTLKETQAENVELKQKLDDTTKLLQEYYNRYVTCDLTLTQIRVVKPKEEKK